jgi:SAM-dependent methyltransferase
MPDRHFADKQLARLYDLFAPWGEPDDHFYIDLVMRARSVLDVGCGTGLLLRKARELGHAGRLVGLDPAEGMLDVARERSDIEWIHGDLSTVQWECEFDLIVMTGHAFQVFVTDDKIRDMLAAVRLAFTDDGRFAFETRNPLVRRWETWTPEHAVEVAYPGGGVARMEHQVELPVEGNIVRFTSTYTAPNLDGPQQSHSTLRFLDLDALTAFLTEAGLAIDALYGDWDRSRLTATSPEIIVIARRG